MSLRVQPRDGPSLGLARYPYRPLFWAVCQFVPFADDDDPFAWQLAVTPSGLDLTLTVKFGLERDKDMKMALALPWCLARLSVLIDLFVRHRLREVVGECLFLSMAALRAAANEPLPDRRQ